MSDDPARPIIDFDHPVIAEAIYRRLIGLKSGRKHTCQICGERSSFDGINMCKKCGDTYCARCVGRPGERWCGCGGEID